MLSATWVSLKPRPNVVKNDCCLFEITFSVYSDKQQLFFTTSGLVLSLPHGADNKGLRYLIKIIF